jgi:hypothetical protein
MVEFAGPMTRDRLKRVLEGRGIDPDGYSLFGGHPAEAYVLDHRRSEWVVYYFGARPGIWPRVLSERRTWHAAT